MTDQPAAPALLYSDVAGRTPSAAQLADGALAINRADNALFFKDAAGSVRGFPLSGGVGRNLVVNGNFLVNQRGYASGTSLGATAYAHDRWRDNYGGGAAYTYIQPTTAEYQAPHATDNLVTITAGALTQPIEPASIAGGTYTLSWVGTAAASVLYYDGTTYRTPAAGAAPLTFALPAGVNVFLVFTPGTLGLVQMERGAIATAFERRPAAIERLLCHRTFQRWTPPPLRGVIVAANAANRLAMPLPVPMRVAPSLQIIGSLVIYDGRTAAPISSIPNTYGSRHHVEFDAYAGGNFTVGAPACVFNDGAGASLDLSAEL